MTGVDVRTRRAARLSAREVRVRDGLAQYADPADVPGAVWDAAVTWAAMSGQCFADIASDIGAVVPDGWDPDDIDAAIGAAVDRMIDDEHGRY